MTMPFYPGQDPAFTYKTTIDYGQLILEILERGIVIEPIPSLHTRSIIYGFTLRLADPKVAEKE